MQPRRHLHARQDVLALADGRVIDPHARIVDHGMHDAVRIGLRGPDVIVDRFCERLARSIEFEDGDDLARLRFLDQVVVVETPVRRGVGAEAAAGMAGVAGRAGPYVQDADLQHVAGFGILDRDRPGQQVDAEAFAGAANERALGRACAAADDGLMLAGPMEHGLGAGIVRDHPLVIVVGVVGQGLDGGAVARAQRQGRRDLLAEISPVNGSRRHRQHMVLHAKASSGKDRELTGPPARPRGQAGENVSDLILRSAHSRASRRMAARPVVAFILRDACFASSSG